MFLSQGRELSETDQEPHSDRCSKHWFGRVFRALSGSDWPCFQVTNPYWDEWGYDQSAQDTPHASAGKYSVKIAKQKAGTKLTVTATKSTGNVSSAKEITVKDKTAPSVPTVNTVADNATSITGKAESNATVYAMVGSKKNRAYSIKITKKKAGTSISVYAIDVAGNKSSSKVVKVVDKTAPSVPTVNKITSKSVTVTGKSEKGASIYIYNGSKKIGQGIVDNQGNYKVKIKAQKKGSTLKIYAKDKAGNKSNSKTVKVS